jgi:thiol-disulfide isomerase/thioredoxin
MSRFLALLLLLTTIAFFPQETRAQNTVEAVFFWGNGCPHCAKEMSFLDKLEKKYPDLKIHRFETWYNPGNVDTLEKIAKAYGTQINAVPVFVIGDDEPIIGYSEYIQKEIIKRVETCIKDTCVNPLKKANIALVPRPSAHEERIEENTQTENLKDETQIIEEPEITDEAKNGTKDKIEDGTRDPQETINVPFVGEIDLAHTPLILTTSLIAFIDGFNPCSTWLIMFLLGMVIHTRSRKKMLIVSLTFLFVTAAAYGAFMLGILNVFMYIGYLKWIQITIAIIALLFASVNIKDYFWFKKGISFTIADKHKSGIFKDMRGIISPDKTTLAMMSATALLALGVVLVELPCTAGFPVIWANLLAKHEVSTVTFLLLFTIYLLIYLLDEIAIVIIAVVTLKVSKFEEKHGRILKLIGGMVMASLALFMLFAPETLNSLQGTFWVFAIAAISSAAIIIVHTKILPKLGIKIEK